MELAKLFLQDEVHVHALLYIYTIASCTRTPITPIFLWHFILLFLNILLLENMEIKRDFMHALKNGRRNLRKVNENLLL